MIEVLLLFNAWLRPSDFPALMRVSAIMVVWALFKVGYQMLARRPEWTHRVPTFWIVTEVVLFTIAVRLVDGVTTSLVIGFPLLIVLSGLWSCASLVWLSLIAAEVGFGWLAIDAYLRGVSWEHANHPDIFMAAMFVIAVAVAHQVKRLWALSRYFEHRPGRV